MPPTTFKIISSILNIPTLKRNWNNSLVKERMKQIRINLFSVIFSGNSTGKKIPNGMNKSISNIK